MPALADRLVDLLFSRQTWERSGVRKHMGVSQKRIPACCALLVALAGCGGSGNDLKPEPVATAPALPSSEMPSPKNLKPKKEPIPDLPAGAGAIDSDAPEELTPTASGLYYRILRQSDGRKPKPTDTVLAHYRGTLDNGQQFDSSYDRGEPTEFPLEGVIKGWTEGLQLIGEGGMIELEIPPNLGYGDMDRPKIPANSTLHFIIELEKVK